MTPLVPYPHTLGPAVHSRQLTDATLRVAGPADVVTAIADLAGRCHGLSVAPADPAQADVVLDIAPQWRCGLTSVGLDPMPSAGDEGYTVRVHDGRLIVRAAGQRGAFRGATTVLQAISHGRLSLFNVDDAPALRWRGLSLDVARCFFSIAQLEAIVDLLAVYRLNVLHLHLTDSQAWRVSLPGWLALTEDGSDSYSIEEIIELCRYAARRHVAVVPEFDMPGHVLAALNAYPHLRGGHTPRHPGLGHLRPDVPEAMRFAREAIDFLCRLSPSPYVHIGADEAFGMDPGGYARFIQSAHAWVHEAGKVPVAWQEASRGRVFGPGDVLQLWISPRDAPRAEELDRRLPPEYAWLRDTVLETFAAAPQDLPRAVTDGAHVLLSPSFPFYLDRRYAEASTDAGQAALMSRLGHEGYPAACTSELYAWQPHDLAAVADGTARVAGAEAPIWCETVRGLDDLSILLLPRLPVLAEAMWARQRRPWQDVAARIAAHTPIWHRLGMGAYYRSEEVFGA